MFPILAIDDEIIPIAAILMGSAVGITALIARSYHRTRAAAYVAHLKDLMIQRGMTAEEIERVIRAEPGGTGGRSPQRALRERTQRDAWPS